MLLKFIAPLSLIVLIVLGATACSHSNVTIESRSDTPITLYSTTISNTSPTLDSTIPLSPPKLDVLPTFTIGAPSSSTVLNYGSTISGCALTSEGEFLCWGWLGRTFQNPYKLPVDNIVGATIGPLDYQHGCVRTSDKELWCWDNRFNGLTNPQKSPVSNVVGIAEHSTWGSGCARTSEGALWCWEHSRFGFETPRQLNVFGVNEIAGWSSPYRGCVLTSVNELWCWTSIPKSSAPPPIPVPGALDPGPPQVLDIGIPQKSFIEDVVDMTSQGCALTSAGELWCWTAYEGNLFESFAKFPIDSIAGISETSSLFGGCANTGDNELWCWNGIEPIPFGGVQDTTPPYTSSTIIPFDRPQKLAVADVVGTSEDTTFNEGCARTASNSLWCWSNSKYSSYKFSNPQQSSIAGVSKLSGKSTGEYGCALTSTEELWCWNGSDSLITRDITLDLARKFPVSNIVGMTKGSDYWRGCATARNNELWCWFVEGQGVLNFDRPIKSPISSTSTTPRPAPTLTSSPDIVVVELNPTTHTTR